jgi:type III pantothenate kinase
MNLVLDLGNTSSKLAIFDADELIFMQRCENSELVGHYQKIKNTYGKIQRSIIANVGQFPDGLKKLIDKDPSVYILSHQSKYPFKNTYATPQTLGVDRIALVSAAATQYPNKNVLVIDAGTCITYDFLDANASYKGGAISPGLSIRYKALNNFTAKLPLLEKAQPEDLIGNSTEQSIHSGVVLGTVKEIDGIIETYKMRYSDLTVILTGGDAKFLSDQLKNSIFANSNFLLTGLNYLLDYNT